MKLTLKDKKKFEKNGYLILNIFSKKDLNQFKKSLLYIIEKQAIKANQNNAKIKITKKNLTSSVLLELEKFNHDYISDISDFIINTTESLQLLANKKLKRSINYLLNNNLNDPLYITNGGPLVAMPKDTKYKYTFHKDTFYTLPKSKYIQIWAPLIKNSTKFNGALQICLKSHLNKWRGQKIFKNLANRHRYQVKKNEVARYKIKNCNLNLGQVLIFSQFLAHQSGTNQSKQTRFSLAGCYHKLNNQKIRPLLPQFKFKGLTPEEYYKELIH